MATRTAHQDTILSVANYDSQRVFDGVRVLSDDAKRNHIARLKKAVAKQAAPKS